jgi:hypothetical protein
VSKLTWLLVAAGESAILSGDAICTEESIQQLCWSSVQNRGT